MGKTIQRTTEDRKQRPNYSGPLSDALRSAIDDFGKRSHIIGELAGVPSETISAFYSRKKSMQLATAEKIARVVGVSLVKPGRESPSGSKETFTDLLISEINLVGSVYAFARSIEVHHGIIRSLTHGRSSPKLWTVDAMIPALSIQVVREQRRWEPSPDSLEAKPPIANPLQPLFDGLRATIKAKGLKGSALAKSSGIDKAGLYRFINSEQNLSIENLNKLAASLGIDLDSIPASAKQCPIELRGKAFPPLVYGREVPRLTGVAYDLVAFAVERYREGGVCLHSELKERTSSTSDRPIKSLKAKLKEPGFDPLARVISFEGRTLKIVDVGPN